MNADPSALSSTPDLTHLPIIQQTLLDWYAREGRDLPWRRTRDPYAILVSELMLQQTQVDRVIPKWEAWLAQFPTLVALAEAPTSAVIKAWSGLGYNRRAINLQRLAQAVAAFAHNRPVAMVDVNIRRLLHRLFVGAEMPDYRLAEGEIWALARAAVPPGRSADWHQALMDLGATICRPRPLCDRCPVRDWCRAAPEWAILPPDAPRPTKSQGKWEGSNRQYRGRILRALGALPHGDTLPLPLLGRQVREEYTDTDAAWLLGLVRALASDGLVLLSGDDEAFVVRLP